MPDILVQARNFPIPYDHINGAHRLSVSHREYLRASLTVGFQSGRDARTGNRRIRADRFLNGIRIYNMLVERPEGLCLAPEFAELDASEKAPHSYWHGTILAKIVADRLMRIPWLANVDALCQQGRVKTTASGKERGDFVGRDQNLAWHALEAKGRSSTVDAETLDSAKYQASRIISVENQRPQTCTGCVSDFSAAPITVHLEDPPPDEEKPRRIDVGDFWGFYYGNLVRFIESSQEKGRVEGLPDYIFARLFVIPDSGGPSQRTDLYLGLPHAIMQNPISASEMSLARAPYQSDYVGKDYVALAGPLPGWPTRMTAQH